MKNLRLSIFTLVLLLISTGCFLSPDEKAGKPLGIKKIYVALNGSDSAPGSESSPVKTFIAAQKLARKSAAKTPVHVIIKPGVYYLDQTLVFTPADSGSINNPVIWRAEKPNTVTISGGQLLDLNFKPYKNGIFQARVKTGFETDQLFINGSRIHMARYPNYDPNAQYYNGFASDAFSPERAKNWKNPAGGFIHAMHKSRWGDMHYLITGKDENGNVTYQGGWQNNRQSQMHKDYRFVENIFDELDAPGEWFCDMKTQTLYIYPPKGVNLNSAQIQSVRLPHLIEFEGRPKDPVKFIELKNLTFTHTARTFMDNKEPLLRSDWTTYRGGAIFFDGAEDCSVKDCLIDQVGSNAVFVNKFNRRITISGCEIANAGASAISFVGDPNSLRSPLFEYHQTQTLDQMDHTPGPKDINYPADCLVDNCLIYRNGRFEKQTAGVNIAMSSRITIRHCSIYDVPRAGINICDGAFGGHIIEWCDVFDTVKETGDHGSFNSWGRDRFWHKDRSVTDKWVEKFPQMPKWDCVETITIRNSRWRCDHGWDIDLDDGSSNYEIYNNLLLNGGLKLREGFFREVYNNIVINNSLAPHCWYDKSRDIVTKNIFMDHYIPARMENMPGKKWGQLIDKNFFTTSQNDRTKFADYGCDANSLVGDPQFVDPSVCDYRVNKTSPALKIGFKNFPIDNFGVTKPSLKAKARKPKFPVFSAGTPAKKSAYFLKWNGMKIRDLTSQNDMSAAGLGSTKGALIDYGNKSHISSLKTGDVILAVEKINIENAAHFIKIMEATQKPVTLHVWRDQSLVTVIFD